MNRLFFSREFSPKQFLLTDFPEKTIKLTEEIRGKLTTVAREPSSTIFHSRGEGEETLCMLFLGPYQINRVNIIKIPLFLKGGFLFHLTGVTLILILYFSRIQQFGGCGIFIRTRSRRERPG